ncbi:family 5 carbohydrate esterase [Colletotrichum kahawae]|uniref:Family 5 carbohydrate esterase n=1 Tax=Colletotrichum kahawae TaxID=34407 RepID=A0AAE0DE48_COLKA|nr:family 5 carbohydrate esterase [Colletotrichum kahawae]
MPPSWTLFTSIAAAVLSITNLARAQDSCRCGDPSFLAIGRVNISSAQPVQTCSPYMILDARGSGEPQGVSLSFQIAIERIITNNSEITTQSIIYPASFDQNVSVGVQNTIDIIHRGLRDCPNQRYSLLGYSQGATVVLEALGKLDNETTKAINAVVLVGNPYRTPGRASNVDSQGHPDNRTQFGMFAAQAMQANRTFPNYDDILDRSGKVRDICLEDDLVCAPNPDCDCQLASDHLSYGLFKSVQDLIVSHIMSRAT